MAPRDPVNQYDYVFLKGEGNKGVSYKYTWGSGTWRLPPGVKASKVCADTAETAPSKGEACAYAGGGCVSDPMSYTTAGGLVTAAPASYRCVCVLASPGQGVHDGLHWLGDHRFNPHRLTSSYPTWLEPKVPRRTCTAPAVHAHTWMNAWGSAWGMSRHTGRMRLSGSTYPLHCMHWYHQYMLSVLDSSLPWTGIDNSSNSLLPMPACMRYTRHGALLIVVFWPDPSVLGLRSTLSWMPAHTRSRLEWLSGSASQPFPCLCGLPFAVQRRMSHLGRPMSTRVSRSATGRSGYGGSRHQRCHRDDRRGSSNSRWRCAVKGRRGRRGVDVFAARAGRRLATDETPRK